MMQHAIHQPRRLYLGEAEFGVLVDGTPPAADIGLQCLRPLPNFLGGNGLGHLSFLLKWSASIFARFWQAVSLRSVFIHANYSNKATTLTVWGCPTGNGWANHDILVGAG